MFTNSTYNGVPSIDLGKLGKGGRTIAYWIERYNRISFSDKANNSFLACLYYIWLTPIGKQE